MYIVDLQIHTHTASHHVATRSVCSLPVGNGFKLYQRDV